MDVSLFDFVLPEELIALRPAVPRDSARLLVVRADGSLQHAHVRDLPQYLRSGYAVVVNDFESRSRRACGGGAWPAAQLPPPNRKSKFCFTDV